VLLLKTLALLVTLACLGYLGWKKPWMLICFLTGSMYLEISRTWFPELGVVPDGLSLAKICTGLLILTVMWRLLSKKLKIEALKEALRQPLTKALLLFLAIGIISICKSNNWKQTLVEDFRLATLIVLFISVYVLGDRQRLIDIFKVFHWAGVTLVPLAVYQGLTKNFIWYKDYADWVPPRVNVTFVDPNIFARYMVIAIIANLILNILQTDKRKHLLYLGTLIPLLIGLWMSYSRAGMLNVVLMSIALVLFLPNKKLITGVGISGLLGIGIISANPAVVQRFADLRKGVNALDPGRLYLWNVAWEIFKDRPLLGVGLGAFQRTFEEYYKYMMLPQFWVTRSHTTLLTVASELGIIGLSSLMWIWICLFRAVSKLRSLTRETYILGVGFFLIVLSVFVSSQFEARFFEDPVIWLCMALLLVLGQGKTENL
jgi:putative inorganic carbon (hco3(-)) transporter